MTLQAQMYEFGHGYKLSSTPLYLGGYLSSTYDINHHKDKFELDDVAILLYGSFEKFDFLAELEANNVKIEKEGSDDFDLTNKTFNLERLYLTLPWQDDTTIILGKFNTNIGFWNQTPINVLHDTTTPPHIMKNLFPKLITGIGYTKDINDNTALSLALQHNNDLDDEYNNLNVDRHYNISLKKSDDDFVWSFAAGYFQEKTDQISTYATLGIQQDTETYTILAEFYLRDTEDAPSVPYDIYIQNTWHIKDKHDLIIRAETYKDEIEDSVDKVGLLGYTYRPYPYMAIKGEYEAHSISHLSHAVFSFSVIF